MKKITIKQTRSSIRHPKVQLKTLKSLGLGKIGKTVQHEATPSVLGMVRAVSHLVTIEKTE